MLIKMNERTCTHVWRLWEIESEKNYPTAQSLLLLIMATGGDDDEKQNKTNKFEEEK